jgi:hypothetical protein
VLTTVDPAAFATQSDRDGLLNVLGCRGFVANRFAVPEEMTARLTLEPASKYIEAALHHAVATLGEDELRALVHRPPHLCLGGEDATQLRQTAAEGLP